MAIGIAIDVAIGIVDGAAIGIVIDAAIGIVIDVAIGIVIDAAIVIVIDVAIVIVVVLIYHLQHNQRIARWPGSFYSCLCEACRKSTTSAQSHRRRGSSRAKRAAARGARGTSE